MQQVIPNVDDKEALRRISNNLRRLRGDVSLSEIARRCKTYPTAIKRIEDGENMPGVGLLTRIAASIHAPFDEFLKPVRKKPKSA